MAKTTPKIANLIASLRAKRGLSLRQAGELAGVTQTTVWLNEQGRTIPTVATLKGYATAFNVPLRRLTDSTAETVAAS